MADRILFIGWNRVVAGREQQAMQLWQKSMAEYPDIKIKLAMTMLIF